MTAQQSTILLEVCAPHYKLYCHSMMGIRCRILQVGEISYRQHSSKSLAV